MRIYSETQNVLEASIERIEFILENFKKVYVSFSGGKDSGVMLNLVLRVLREKYPDRRVGLMIMDNEANYTYSLDFMHRMVRANRDILDVYWCCLPITLPCTVSSYAVDWQCWGEGDKDKWVRPMPQDDYIVNMSNHNMPFFRENMNYDEFWDKFGEWYSGGEKTACLIGIRTSESLNRFRAIMNDRKEMLDGKFWTKKNGQNVYNCYPIYDWETKDIWKANEIFDWDYNKLYDIFYRAGVPVGKMRVASPFMSESKSSLNLYRVIDSHVWARLCGRVSGANFVATYGKQINYKSFKLPPNHTWKTFTKFLLNTLPKEVSENFRNRFAQSIIYWGRVGRGLKEEIIEDLERNKIDFKINGYTRHGSQSLKRVRLVDYPDHLDMLRCHNSEVASWKRLALTILKNDHTCKYLGLAPTKEQAERQKYIQKKYKGIMKKEKK